MLEQQLARAWQELSIPQIVALRTVTQSRLLAIMFPRQVGKTHFGCWLNREVMRQNTNLSTLFLAKDFPSITRATKEKFQKLFPEDQFKVSAISGITHIGKSQKEGRGTGFMSGVDKVPDKLRGGTMGLIHWSEVAFSKFESGTNFQDVYQQITLPMILRTRGLYLMESTPNGKNFWYEFWENDPNFVKLRLDVDFCIRTGALKRDEVDFLEKTMHPDVFNQEMNCAFVSFTGKVYSEFDQDAHCETGFQPESHEMVIVGIDVGFTAASSAIFAVWRNKELHIFDQVYGTNLRTGEFANRIEERLESYKVDRRRWVGYTDHDPEMVEELQSRGIKVTLADKVDLFAARMSIKEGLHARQIKLNHIKCQWLYREIGAAAWSERTSDTMEMSGDPNGNHWDSEASFRYLWRGARLELEKPEVRPEGMDKNQSAEWEAQRKKREAKKNDSRIGAGQEFEG